MRKNYQWAPKEKRNEIVVAYLTGDNSVEELANYYKVNANTIRSWINRYRHSLNVVSLQTDSKHSEDMARKKKEAEKSADVQALEARIRELELQNLALNTLIDVAEKNGIDIRKKSGAKQ
jgi:transposase-like protein